jgi:hypothetical protein
MAAPEMPVVRLTSPGEIVAAIPHLCGFSPTESLVVVSLRGDRRRIGLTMRFDLPDGLDDAAAEEVASRLAHDGASSAVFVVYTDAPGDRPRERLARAVIEAIELRGMTVMEGLLVRGGCWSSYTCSSPRCCPPSGTPIPAPADLLAATAAYDGRAVLRDRAELVASLAPPVLLEARVAQQRLDAELVRWCESLVDLGREQAVAAALAALRSALVAPAEDTAPLIVALQDLGVRDEVATWALDDTEALLSLLLALARESVAPYDVPVCTLVALVAWVRGDGALANVALDRALDGDPTYNMAKLFRAGLDGQLPPSEVKAWLRQTKRTLHPRRRRRAA